jgi:hypothetical protein
MPDVSRRVVLTAGAGLAGLVVLGFDETDAAAATGAANSKPLRSNYTKAVGKVFTAVHAGRTHRLRLTHVRDLAAASAAHRPHCFNLIFTPVSKARLHDAIYVLAGPDVRTHKLFLSAIGTDGVMQAIVNRRH